MQGRQPRIPTYSVCVECKRRGAVCVAVAHGALPGPGHAGGLRCAVPGVQPGCYGCFGPQDSANTASLAQRLLDGGMRPVEVQRFFRTFNAGAEAFRAESQRHESQGDRPRPLEPSRWAHWHVSRGEGGMLVEVHDGRVEKVQLNIFEPPRFFEALLRGRDYSEAPDITAGSAASAGRLSDERLPGHGGGCFRRHGARRDPAHAAVAVLR